MRICEEYETDEVCEKPIAARRRSIPDKPSERYEQKMKKKGKKDIIGQTLLSTLKHWKRNGAQAQISYGLLCPDLLTQAPAPTSFVPHIRVPQFRFRAKCRQT